jgi:hypothetical protein
MVVDDDDVDGWDQNTPAIISLPLSLTRNEETILSPPIIMTSQPNEGRSIHGTCPSRVGVSFFIFSFLFLFLGVYTSEYNTSKYYYNTQ